MNTRFPIICISFAAFAVGILIGTGIAGLAGGGPDVREGAAPIIVKKRESSNDLGTSNDAHSTRKANDEQQPEQEYSPFDSEGNLLVPWQAYGKQLRFRLLDSDGNVDQRSCRLLGISDQERERLQEVVDSTTEAMRVEQSKRAKVIRMNEDEVQVSIPRFDADIDVSYESFENEIRNVIGMDRADVLLGEFSINLSELLSDTMGNFGRTPLYLRLSRENVYAGEVAKKRWFVRRSQERMPDLEDYAFWRGPIENMPSWIRGLVNL